MRFDILTIFPQIFDYYFKESIIKRARQKGLIKIETHNLRQFTKDKHKTVDDKPYGGGPGMVMMVEPIYKAIKSLKLKKGNKKSKIILLSVAGKQFDAKMAKRFSKLERLILISGHYEGVDERVAEHIADEEISIGPYVLTGGELPAMVIVDAVTRFVTGVIKKESLEEYRGGGYPAYTRPEIFLADKEKWKVPEVLLSGNHKKIDEWRDKKVKERLKIKN